MKIVIDAGVAVHTVLETALSSQAALAWESWRRHEASLYAPCLWLSEVTSAVHLALMAGAISERRALESLNTALELDVEWIAESRALCRGAFRFASRLKQYAAYDGIYLALAEDLKAEFWTADKRLAHSAQAAGLAWVHDLDEAQGA